MRTDEETWKAILAEAIEHIGETKCWVSDLEQAWARESDSARTVVQRADAIGVLETDFSAPRAAVWDLVTRPENRLRWQGIDSVVENTANGRRVAGTQNHCMHGKDAIIEDILAWRPFDHITLTTLLPVPGRSQDPDVLCVRRTGGRRPAF